MMEVYDGKRDAREVRLRYCKDAPHEYLAKHELGGEIEHNKDWTSDAPTVAAGLCTPDAPHSDRRLTEKQKMLKNGDAPATAVGLCSADAPRGGVRLIDVDADSSVDVGDADAPHAAAGLWSPDAPRVDERLKDLLGIQADAPPAAVGLCTPDAPCTDVRLRNVDDDHHDAPPVAAGLLPTDAPHRVERLRPEKTNEEKMLVTLINIVGSQ